MRTKIVSAYFILLACVLPALATVEPASGPMYLGHASSDADEWRRVDLRSETVPLRNVSQIKIAIHTKWPPMQGLIRIPGGIASNFDTGNGATVVDLINIGDEARGYAEIVALEVLFTRSKPGQSFQVFTVDYVK
jgi:hypothetical protein